MNSGKIPDDRMIIFEKILKFIPNFRGYLQPEFRREADRLLRDFIIGILKNGKNKLTVFISDVAREKRLDLLTEYDDIIQEIEKLINETNFADSGYPGFFDQGRIKESQLEEIYRFDSDLLDQTRDFSMKIESLSQDPLNKNEVRLVRSYLGNISTGFKSRNEILHDYSEC